MKLAWKEIKHNRSKYLMIEGILILMIFMVLFLSGLANGLSRAVSASIENMDAAGFIMSEESDQLLTMSAVTPDEFTTLNNELTTELAPFNIQRMNVTKSDSTEKLDITYIAIDPDSFLNPQVISGSKLGDTANGIVLDSSFEEEGIQAGDVIKDYTTGVTMTVTGFTKDQMYGHTAAGFISTDTYVAIRTAINENYQPVYHAVAAKDAVDVAALAAHLSYETKKDVVSTIPGYSAEQMTINMILWVLVVISSAILGVFFYIITIQKEKQFGVMKAIGFGMGKITAMILSQVLLLACIGTLTGNALTYLMAMALPAAMPFYLKSADTMLVSVVFIVIAVACSMLSTRKVSAVDPIICIGGNS